MEGVLEEQAVPGFWYLVATADTGTFVLQGSNLDRMYQLLSVLKPVTVGSQITDWQVDGSLPEGMVLESAVHLTPDLGAFPSLSLRNGRIQIEMRPEPSLTLIAGWPGVGDRALGAQGDEVSGALGVLGHGYVVDNGLGFIVAAFDQADGTTMYATGSDIPRDEFLSALAAVTYVDEATWLQRYRPDPTDVLPDGRVVEANPSVTEAATVDTAPSTSG